jgi:hypothetical protein
MLGRNVRFPPNMKIIYLVANGDLRLSANQMCQPAQAELEKRLTAAIEREGYKVERAHPFDKAKEHGFIDSQKMGLKVFATIPKDAPVVVAEAVWQYSQHLLGGLISHRGPILTVANWSGTWPGLVGLLNLNGSLTKAGVRYSSIWSEDFTDEFFTEKLRRWLRSGKIQHDSSHVQKYKNVEIPAQALTEAGKIVERFQAEKAILGVFDEGCMGMYNAIIPDELLHPLGIYKERLSQATLYARMQTVSEGDAVAVHDWLVESGFKFKLGKNEETDLTKGQILQQCKMYVATVRIADEFGCATIGIQYQQGLKDLAPASDLVEGILNNVDRPPVLDEKSGEELYPGQALPVFNEVDECAAVDALVTNRIWLQLGYSPETTLHDLRWGRQYKKGAVNEYVWVFLISGGAPPAHFIDGYKGASSERQPPMYFRLGGGTCKGVSKPGWIVWSRVYVVEDQLKFDTGLAEVVELPKAETEERWKLTTPQWPIMHAVLKGVTRDQMMARHKSNHIQVAYAPDEEAARLAMFTKAATMNELGMKVFFCGQIESD